MAIPFRYPAKASQNLLQVWSTRYRPYGNKALPQSKTEVGEFRL